MAEDNDEPVISICDDMQNITVKPFRQDSPCDVCGSVLTDHDCRDDEIEPSVKLVDESSIKREDLGYYGYTGNTIVGQDSDVRGGGHGNVVCGPFWDVNNSERNLFIGNGNVPTGKVLHFEGISNKTIISADNGIWFLKYVNGVPVLEKNVFGRITGLERRIKLLEYNMRLLLADRSNKRPRETQSEDDSDDLDDFIEEDDDGHSVKNASRFSSDAQNDPERPDTHCPRITKKAKKELFNKSQ